MTDSTTEAEYITASESTKEGVWMRRFLIDLGVFPKASSPLNLHCDNNGAIAQAKEPRNHQKSKHVLWKFHIIREFVRQDEIKMCKIHTDLNVANPLTKALPQPNHEAHMRAMVLDIFEINSSASGRLLGVCPRDNHRDDYIALYP